MERETPGQHPRPNYGHPQATFAAMEVNTNPNDYITVSATFDPDALRERFAAALGRWLAADDGCNIG